MLDLDVVVPDQGEGENGSGAVGFTQSITVGNSGQRGVSELFQGVVAKAVKTRTRQVCRNSALHEITNTID